MDEDIVDPSIRVRPATLADAGCILAWRNDPDSIQFSRTRSGVSEAEHREWLEARLSDPECWLWIGEAKHGRPIGQIRVERTGDEAEIHIAVAADGRGRGYGKALIRALQERSQELVGVRRLIARVDPDNTASVRAFEACEFRSQGFTNGFTLLSWLPGQED